LKNNKLENIVFLNYVLENAPGRKKSGFIKRTKPKLKVIIGDRDHVTAESFYHVINLLNMDIDKLCNLFFKDQKYKLLYKEGGSDNKLNQLVFILTKTKKEIYTAVNIESTRFTRLSREEFKELYPNEVNNLAKSLNLKPSLLFNYFYGGSTRPTILF